MKTWLMQLALLSLSGTVLLLIVRAVRRLMRNRLPKAFFYYVWLLVLLRFLLPFGYGLVLPVPSGAGEGSTVPTNAVSPSVQETMPSPIDGVLTHPDAAAGPGTAESGAGQQPAAAAVPTVAQMLFGVWLLGAAGSLGWHLAAYVVFVHSVRKSCCMPRAEEQALFRSLQPKSRVRLRSSGAIETPMLIGLVRPVILLPAAPRLQNLDKSALTAILRHELTHYRRRDILYKWLVVLVTSIHWFNPFVYGMRRQIGLDCELACDEAVVRSMTAAQRMHYGDALLALAARNRSFPGVTATTLCEEKRQLKARLLGIRHGWKPTKAALAGMLACTLMFAGCACAAFRLPDSTAPASSAGAETTVDGVTPGSAYRAVLLGQATLRLETEGGTPAEYGIADVPALFSPDSDYAAVTAFTVLDLDGDGRDEAVLHVTDVAADLGGYLILREQDGTVQGFSGDWRMFEALKTDGTFSYSTAAGTEGGAARLQFSENGYTAVPLFYWQGAQFVPETFWIEGQTVTAAVYDTAQSGQNEKTDAVWYPFDETHIRSCFAEDRAPADDSAAAASGAAVS